MRKNNQNNRGRHRGNNNRRSYGNNRGGNDGQNLQRQKHHATQMLGKFSDMARNAQNNGDRVDVEYYLQHVDHYTRVLTEIAGIEAERHQQFREQQGYAPNEAAAADGEASQMEEDGQSDDPQSDATRQHARGPRGRYPQGDRPRTPRAYEPAPAAPYNPADEAADPADIPLPGSALPPV